MAKNETVLNLDPAKVLARDNARFALLDHRVDAMADSILTLGGIQIPVIVQKLKTPENGFTHELISGFYRHAAALKLNTEQNAGLPLPALVREPQDAVDRLMRQVSENKDRENLSPMDEAIAIKRMLDAGVNKETVRKVFARPGGRKGLAMQPASNAHINMVLSFLELPKAIQSKLHDGRVGVAAGYELTKVPKDQQDAILAKAEEARLKAFEREEKQEVSLDKTAAKQDEREAKLKTVSEALTMAEQAKIDAMALHETAAATLKEARKVPENYLDMDEAGKKAVAEKIGGAKTALREAEKVVSIAARALDKAQRAHKAVADPEPKAATEATEKPAKAAKPGKKAAAVGPKDVKTAAAKAGVKGAKPVPLSAQSALAAAGILAKSRFAKVKAIGAVLVKMLDGTMTPAQAETDLTVLTGERQTKKA